MIINNTEVVNTLYNGVLVVIWTNEKKERTFKELWEQNKRKMKGYMVFSNGLNWLVGWLVGLVVLRVDNVENELNWTEKKTPEFNEMKNKKSFYLMINNDDESKWLLASMTTTVMIRKWMNDVKNSNLLFFFCC